MRNVFMAAAAALALVGCRVEVETDRDTAEKVREAREDAERGLREAGRDLERGARDVAEETDEAVGGSGDQDVDRR